MMNLKHHKKNKNRLIKKRNHLIKIKISQKQLPNNPNNQLVKKKVNNHQIDVEKKIRKLTLRNHNYTIQEQN